MKKAKLLALLSVSMILAACGGKKTPTSSASAPDVPTSSETLSSIGEETSSSVEEKEPTYEESKAAFIEGYEAIREGAKSLSKDTFSFTETQVISMEEESEETTGEIGKEPIYTGGKKQSMTQAMTVGYDAKNKVGYTVEEVVLGDERVVSDAYWVEVVDGKYIQYDWDYERYYEVDDDYAWHCLADEGIRFGMDFAGGDDSAAVFESMSEDMSLELKRMFNSLKGSFPAESIGEVKFNDKVVATNKKVGNGGELYLSIVSSVEYDASTLDLDAIGTNPYLAEFTAAFTETITFKYSDKGIESAEGEMGMMSSMGVCADGMVVTEKSSQKQIVSDTSKHEYVPLAYEFDTTGYEDRGKTSSSLWVALPNARETEITQDDRKMGEKYALDDSYIVSSDAKAAGVTYELYEDRALTKKLDKDNIVAKSYSETVYVKYIVPSTVAYVQYVCKGVLASDFDSRDTNWYATTSGEYIGPSKSGFFAPAYTKTNVYDYNAGETIPSATFASTSAEISYTTDAKASVKNNKMVDIKAGEFYYISFICDQVV
ncbi:MAG: hypothetical protein MJ220_02900 [Bacilli bacterium]|nr:hypothetical protein [Bacilli bacterium]